MNPDEYAEIYNKGVISGQKHSEPSSETKTFMDKIGVSFEYMKTEIQKINTNLEKNSQEHQEMQRCLGNYVPQEKCDKNTNNLLNKVENINTRISELPEKLIEKLDKKYVSKEVFNPVAKTVTSFKDVFVSKEAVTPIRLIAYGIITVVVTAFVYVFMNKIADKIF